MAKEIDLSKIKADQPDLTKRLNAVTIMGADEESFTRPLEMTSEGIRTRQWGLKLLKFARSSNAVRYIYENRDAVFQLRGGLFVQALEKLVCNPVTGHCPRYQSPGQILLDVRHGMAECGVKEEIINEFSRQITEVKKELAPEAVSEGELCATGIVGVGVVNRIEYGAFEASVPIIKEHIDEAVLEDGAVRMFKGAVQAVARANTQRGDFPRDARNRPLASKFNNLEEEGLSHLKEDELRASVARMREYAKSGEADAGKKLDAEAAAIMKEMKGIAGKVYSKANEICGNTPTPGSDEEANTKGVGDFLGDFSGFVAKEMVQNLMNPEWAVAEVADPQINKLKEMPKNVALDKILEKWYASKNGMLQALTGMSADQAVKDYIKSLPWGAIVVADHLGGILDTREFDWKVGGVGVVHGSSAQHVCINLKKAGVPTVVGISQGVFDKIQTGDTAIVVDEKTGESGNGLFIYSPYPETLDEWVKRKEEIEKELELLKRNNHLPSVTEDGVQHHLYANIDSAQDLLTTVLGSIIYKGVEYDFQASNVRDKVIKVTEKGGHRREEVIFEGRLSKRIPDDMGAGDREVIEWIKGIEVDEVDKALAEAAKEGIEVLGHKRISGAVGLGAQGAGLIRSETFFDTLGKWYEPMVLEALTYEWAKAISTTWMREAMRNTVKYAEANTDDHEGIAYLEARMKNPVFTFRLPDYSADKPLPEYMVGRLKGYGSEEQADDKWHGGVEFLIENRENLLDPYVRGVMKIAKELSEASGDVEPTVNIMIPMATKAEQVEEILKVIDENADELDTDYKPKIVPLIEEPEAVKLGGIERMLMLHKDSIAYVGWGSNDWTANALGHSRFVKGRFNELKVLEPAKDLVELATINDLQVVICGEDGGRGINLPLLMSMGVMGYSMVCNSIPHMKGLMRFANHEETKQAGDAMLAEIAATPGVESAKAHEMYGDWWRHYRESVLN